MFEQTLVKRQKSRRRGLTLALAVTLHGARLKLSTIRRFAGQFRSLIEEEERHADEVTAAEESDVRSRQREIDFGDTQESWQRVRQQ